MKETSKRTPLYAQVRDYVIDHIRSGKWRAGRKLPSETQLSKQFDVSRITIRSAMAKLVEEGIVYRVQGRGSYVGQYAGEKEPIRYAKPDLDKDGLHLVALILPKMRGNLMTRLTSGVEAGLDGSRYRILLMTTDYSQAKEEEKLREAVQAGAQGIIIYPSDGQTYNEGMLRLSLDRYPIVVLDRYLRGVETNCVCSDHYTGAYEATEQLLRQGHRRIAFVSPACAGTTSLEERLEGYRQALNDYGVIFDKSRVLERGEQEEIEAFLKDKTDLTALFGANEEIGLNAIRAAEKIGKAVPERMSVIFFDDYDHSGDARIPPTCITQQGERIGREAANRVLSLIEDPHQSRVMIRVPTRLIVRGSTAPVSEGID
ncbi:GntR family transcriptional regulator [Cohnella soli]|uniref:GntR family transcriptional regulator n=1 Tax=Cohnella soli TaxID=425005 RepID=A0ABW0I1N0_9BACL